MGPHPALPAKEQKVTFQLSASPSFNSNLFQSIPASSKASANNNYKQSRREWGVHVSFVYRVKEEQGSASVWESQIRSIWLWTPRGELVCLRRILANICLYPPAQREMSTGRNKHFYSPPCFFFFFPPVLAPFPRGTDRSVQVELSTETPTSLKVTQKKDEGKAAGRWEETEMELHCQSLKNLKAEMRTRPGSHEAGAELQLWNQFYNLKEKKHFNFYFSDGAFSSTWRRSICKINQKVVTDSLLLGG